MQKEESFPSSNQMKVYFAFYLYMQIEKHLHTLPPSAAPHWLTVWKSTIPTVASSPLTARFQILPTFSLFRPPRGPFGSTRRLCPSWTVRPPIGCSCSSPPATGCAPGPAPPQLLSDWPTGGPMRQERGTAPHSRTVVERRGQMLVDPPERWHDAKAVDVKASQSESGRSPCHCCCRVIYKRLKMEK